MKYIYISLGYLGSVCISCRLLRPETMLGAGLAGWVVCVCISCLLRPETMLGAGLGGWVVCVFLVFSDQRPCLVRV